MRFTKAALEPWIFYILLYAGLFMARRRRTHRKIQPAELNLQFCVPGTGDAENYYIDIAQCLSELNRKAYRQGYEYQIQSARLESTGEAKTMMAFALSKTWCMYNAHTKGYALWKQQQDDVMEQAGLESTIAKYRDFKVLMDNDHNASDNLRPCNIISLAAAQAVDPDVSYSWNISDVFVPNADGTVGDTDQFALIMTGSDTSTRKSLIKAYAESRARPPVDPNIVDVPMGGLFGEMFNDGMADEEIIDDVQQENARPPYMVSDGTDHQFYPGAQEGFTLDGKTQPFSLSTGAAGERLLGSFAGSSLAPLGLLQVAFSAFPIGEQANLTIVIAPGPYKGAMAIPMRDVN